MGEPSFNKILKLQCQTAELLAMSTLAADSGTAWSISQQCVKWSICHSTNTSLSRADFSSHWKWQSCWDNLRQFTVMCINSRPYLSDIRSFNIPLQLCNTCLATYVIKIWFLYVGCTNPSRNVWWIFISYISFLGHHYFFIASLLFSS